MFRTQGELQLHPLSFQPVEFCTKHVLIRNRDLPHTIFQTAQASMVISPHNYLVGSPVQRSNQAIKISMGNSTISKVDYMGANRLTCSYDLVCH
jgi:primary-amine oxidase